MERYRPERFRVRSATSRRANCSCCCIRLRVREAAAPEIRMRPNSPRNAANNTQRRRWDGQSGSGEAVMRESSEDVFMGTGRQGIATTIIRNQGVGRRKRLCIAATKRPKKRLQRGGAETRRKAENKNQNRESGRNQHLHLPVAERG